MLTQKEIEDAATGHNLFALNIAQLRAMPSKEYWDALLEAVQKCATPTLFVDDARPRGGVLHVGNAGIRVEGTTERAHEGKHTHASGVAIKNDGVGMKAEDVVKEHKPMKDEEFRRWRGRAGAGGVSLQYLLDEIEYRGREIERQKQEIIMWRTSALLDPKSHEGTIHNPADDIRSDEPVKPSQPTIAQRMERKRASFINGNPDGMTVGKAHLTNIYDRLVDLAEAIDKR